MFFATYDGLEAKYSPPQKTKNFQWSQPKSQPKKTVIPKKEKESSESFKKAPAEKKSDTTKTEKTEQTKKTEKLKLQKTFFLLLKYEKGEWIKAEMAVIPAYLSPYQQESGDYIATLTDQNGKILQKKYFDFSWKQTLCAEPQWFDRLTGKQIYVPSKEEKFQRQGRIQTVPYMSVMLPYDPDGKTVLIMNTKFRKIMIRLNVSHLTSPK
ncbi:MAG: hypothetical protein Q8P84_05765 [Deltaproteobacteria bacterium]|nr:hypothetical protein [Deltaproteobacteria bacterium]